MDNPTHALMIKQCFHCLTFKLLTQANWPQESLEDPSKSCCRDCTSMRESIDTQGGSANEDNMTCVFDPTPTAAEAKQFNGHIDYTDSSVKVEDSETLQSPQGVEEKDADAKMSDCSISTRSIMASRWATNNSPSKSPVSSPTSPITPKGWLKQREDLFSGSANVNNASSKIFNSMPSRNEKRGTAGSARFARGDSDQKHVRNSPSHMAMQRSDEASRARGRIQLTGANVSALNRDNGWATRETHSSVHGQHNSVLTPIFHTNENGFPLGQQNNPYNTHIPFSLDQHIATAADISKMNSEHGRTHEQNNQDLLESIARLQIRNMKLLSQSSAARTYGDHEEPQI